MPARRISLAFIFECGALSAAFVFQRGRRNNRGRRALHCKIDIEQTSVMRESQLKKTKAAEERRTPYCRAEILHSVTLQGDTVFGALTVP